MNRHLHFTFDGKRWAFLLALLMQLGLPASYAQSVSFPIREMSNKLYANTLTTGSSKVLTIANDARSTMVASPSTFSANVKYKSNHTIVKLAIDHAATTVPTAPYVYKLIYKIEGCPNISSCGGSYPFTAFDTLVIGYNPDSLTGYQDVQIKVYPKLYEAKVTLVDFYNITSGAPVPMTYPLPNQNFFVELSMQYQPYLKTHYLPEDMGLDVSSAYDAATRLLNVSWTPKTTPYLGSVTPAYYELEWCFADNYRADGWIISSDKVPYDFKHNATRIITDSLNFKIPVIYPKGFIAYRVRMVRLDSNIYRNPIYGVWSVARAASTMDNLSGVFQIITPYSGDSLNWNSTIHFAEGGKYKHVVGYFDGLLKNRQTITRFNSRPDQLLATENIYDYEGRQAITTLPTVINSSRFGYQKDVSVSSVTGLPYSASDFDAKPTLCPDEVLIPPFTDASLANKYYSRLNTDTSGMQKFVPQAEGYPFIHKQLSPGFSDRVERMSGAGPELQISKGHDTRNEYVSADQPDLNNLFGINAGYSNFYSKIVGTDPNGQNSLTVKDYKGNQVITSLIGAAVDTVHRAMIYNDEVPGAKNFKEDRLATGIGNVTVGSEKRYSGSYYMDIDAASTITYEYDFQPYTVCPAPYLGLTVKGSFQYSVHDDCGLEKLNRYGILGTTGVTTNPDPPAATSSNSLSLVKGKYNINKTLTVAEADVDAAVDSFMAYSPSCLKTENEFIREAVEQTTYPCAAIDPCADLKKKMMEELFTGAKYGRYIPDGSGSITPSIYDIQNIPGLPPDLYRYQAPCVASELSTLVITKYGKTYTRLDTVSRETFMMLYTGDDRYKIARALLPLHPEFCKLGSCFADTFETRFKALPDAATAVKYNLFSLDSIVAQDAWLRSQLFLSPFLMTNVADSLKLISKGTERMDTVAAGFAFCTANEALVFDDARRFFRNNIVNLSFPSTVVKNNYFEKLRSLYLANRDHYKSMLQSGRGRSCAPCDSLVRMELIPPPVIPLKTGTDGSIATGPGSYLGMFSDSMKAKIAGYTGSTTSYPDTTAIKGKLDSARALVARGDSIQNSVAVDTILSRMANCFSSPAVKARLKDTLLAIIGRGEVHNGLFLPEQVRSGLTKAGIALTDLCHPYLATYDFYNENPASGISCGPNNLYDAAKEFFNSTGINIAIRNTTTTASITTPSWPTPNLFASKVATAITGGSGSISMKTIYRSYDSTYRFSFFRSGSDTVTISLLSPGNVAVGITRFPFFSFPGTGRIVFDNVFCYFDDPNTAADGYITKFLFRAKVRREDITGSDTNTVRANMVGWNDGKVALNEDASNKIATCIPCTQFRDAFNSFADSMSFYGGFAADHPLFFQSLRNFMNYNLKRVYSADQYKRFLTSCALGDSMNIPQYGGYGKITFPSGGYSSIDAFAAALDASDGLFVRAELDYTVGGTAKTAIIDYRTIPYNKIKLFNDRLLAAGGTLKTPPASVLGIVLLPSGTSTDIATDGTILSLTSSILVYVRKSPFLPATEAYRLYQVTGSGAPLPQISRGWALMEKNLRHANIQGYLYSNSLSTVNDDYFNDKKKQLLQYIYSMQSLPYSKVLDSMQDYFIRSNISGFTGSNVSYADPANPYKFTDLFYTDATKRFPGYDTVNRIFSLVNTALGGKKLFLPTATNVMNITGGIPAGYQLKAYRCADGLYWYRYFGKKDQLFDIYLRMPEYLYKNAHPAYELITIIPVTGDTVSSRFTAMLKISGTNDTVYANGSADFNIAWTSRFRDVLLGNDANYGGQDAPISGNAGAVNNCEQDLLYNDIQEGKTNYENYVTKFRDDLKVAFRDHVMKQVKEKLWIEYADMRFGTALYSYDLANNLIQTVPPEGIVKIDTTTAKIVDSLRSKKMIVTAAIPHHLKTTEYEYNTFNKPWKESTPDAGTKVMYYDAKGNVLLSQGAKQRLNTRYTYFLYDGQNRLMETGEVQWGDCGYFDPIPLYTYSQEHYVKSNKPNSCACENLVDSVWEFCDPTLNTSFYDDAIFNAQIRAKPRTQVIYTVFDSAFVPLATKPGMSEQSYLRNRIAANMYYNSCAPGLPALNYDHATHYSYDVMGNVQTLTQDFPQLEGMKQRYKRIDYEYDLLSGKVNMIAYNRGYADQYFQRYGYDADNRITLAETSRDGFIWKRDAAYTYYQHGPLARVSIGDQRVQGVDYAYTLQGWLKSINGDRIDSLVDMGGDGKRNTITPKDAYATAIDYFPGDYKPIGYTPVSTLPASPKGLYNGNIARQANDVANFGALVTAYTYDQMNRIRKAGYAKTNSTALAYNSKYASAYKYDMDGNIRQLWRKDSSSNTMDSLVYEYPVKDNKLANVLDYAAFSRADVQDLKQFTATGLSRMLYDKDGNVIKDLTSNTDSIKWNIYGKATGIINNMEKSELNFGYDALGQRTYKTRVRKTDSGSVERSTYYVREASGNIMAEYIAERELDKGGTTQVMNSLRGQIGTTDVKHTWLMALHSMGYLVAPEFSSYILSTRGPSTLNTAGFYLANNPTLTQQFVYGGIGVLRALSTYSAATKEYPISDALKIGMVDDYYGILPGICSDLCGNPEPKIKGHSAELLIKNIPQIYRETIQNNGITINGANDSVYMISIIMNELLSDPDVLNDKLIQYYLQNPRILDQWLDAVTSDSLYMHSAWFQQSGFIDGMQAFLQIWGDMAAQNKAIQKGTLKEQEGLYGFATWWSNGLAMVQQLSPNNQLASVSYFNDPVRFLETIPGYGAVDSALSLVPNWDIIGTASVLNIPIGLISQSTAPALKRQELRLGNHHIYGSARLGILQYFPDQYRHSWDFRTGIIDTQKLIKSPWYSSVYNDIIDTGKLEPWGNGLTRTMTSQHVLGLKQYELTNQLGNVQATVSDKRFVKTTGNGGTRDYFNPSIVAAYDYYPYGQLMPDRWTNDTSTQCITTTQVQMVPRKVLTSVPATSWTFDTSIYLGYAGSFSPGFPYSLTYSPSGMTYNSYKGGTVVSFDVTPGIPIEVKLSWNFLYSYGAQIWVYEYDPASTGSYHYSELANGGLSIVPGTQTYAITPKTNKVNISIRQTWYYGHDFANYNTVTPLWTITGLTYEKIIYEPQSVLVQLCNKAEDKYEFGFNGQYKDNEVAGIGNWLNFDERMYNSRIARFPTADPLMKQFSSQSPYIFAGNSPIMNIDKKGAYKVSANDVKEYNRLYPVLVKYLATQVQKDIMRSTKIINSYNSFINNSENKDYVSDPNYLKTITTWGSGPTIKFDPAPGNGPDARGHYTPGAIPDDDQIEINSTQAKVLNDLLDSKASDKVKQVAFMRFYMTLVHETGHRVNTPDGIKGVKMINSTKRWNDPYFKFQTIEGEEGSKVEQDVWGTSKYRPWDVSKDLSAKENQGKSDADMMNVIDNANKTEEGKATLPTVPNTTSH